MTATQFRLLCVAFLLLTSCVEHQIFFQLHPDGDIYAKIESRGDSLDIHDYDFIHPSFLNGSSKKEKYQQGQEINYRHVTEGIIQDSVFIFVQEGEIPLGYSIKRFILKNWFLSTYSLMIEFNGRKIKNTYPKLYEAILSEKTDSLYWLPEALVVLLEKSLHDIYGDTILPNQKKQNQRIANHLNNSFARMTSIEDLNRIQKNRLAFFTDLLVPLDVHQELPTQIVRNMKPHEDKLKSTIDLNDDHFIVKMVIPGQVSSTNASEFSGDTLVWNFTLDSLLSTGYTLHAQATVSAIDDVEIVLIFAGFLILVFIVYRMNKKT